MTKASDNEYPSVLYAEQGSNPSTPASGFWRSFFKSDGLYAIDDGGNVTGPFVSSSSGTSLPTFVAAGSSATGTGDITPGLPAGHTTNDINILFVQTSNQSVSAPAGWARLGPAAGFGSAAAAGSTRLTIFWKRDSGADSDPTVTDPGDHALAQIIGIRGCVTSGDPFLCVGATKKTTASTTGTASAGGTPVNNCLVINAFATSLDSASAAFSSFTNADLGSVTERVDVGTTDGTGGGIGVCTGTKAVAGNFAATTVTETSTTDVSLTFIVLPAGISERAGFIDRQVFLTAGLADTWTRPTGARDIRVTAIGGGGGGSAGRNAATAAGGGGGGGGHCGLWTFGAAQLAATATVTAGAGGAATANSDGAASNNGANSTFVVSAVTIAQGNQGVGGSASGSGSGGAGGNGGGIGTAAAATTTTYDIQGPGGGTGGTTAAAGGAANGDAGGAGAGGGTTQAGSAGGYAIRGGGGGGGGRSNTNVGTGGAGLLGGGVAGGATAGANGADSPYPEYGGAGGAGGTSAAGPGGTGGWPGGGGGGGGSQSGAQRGGAGGDGVVVVTTFCG